MPEPKLNEQELLAADLSSLSTEDMARRSMMINIRKAEREMEVISNENETYQIKKAERERMKKLGVEMAEDQRQKVEREQSGCSHKTGGEGLRGFFTGDGAIYGSCTAMLTLPTGEIYFLCFRCQKEWHRPLKRDVLKGAMTLAQYYAKEREYIEVSRWSRKTFEPWNGENCAASTFRIPALELQRAKDDVEFANFLNKQSVANAV